MKKIAAALQRLYRKGIIGKITIYVILILISYQFLYPILRMISFSMMSERDIMNPSVTWIPKSMTFNNLRVAALTLNLRETLVGSLWFTLVLSVCQTFVSTLTGYAFARYEFPFKKFWFLMVLMTFIIPLPVVIIPRIMIFTSIQESWGIQMIGTPIPQIVLSLFGQGVYSTVLILISYNFTRMIPQSLDEAAAIDGANPFQIFIHIIMRLSISTILVIFLFSFVWNWNESYLTTMFLRGRISLLPQRLVMFDDMFSRFAQSGGGGSGQDAQLRLNEAYKMAGTFISIIPLLTIYLFVQRQFIKGIENAGITGE